MVFSQYRSSLENWELMSSLHEYSLTFMSLLIKIFRLGNLLGQEDPLEWETATTPAFLLGRSHRQESGELQSMGHKELTQVSIYVCTIPCRPVVPLPGPGFNP